MQEITMSALAKMTHLIKSQACIVFPFILRDNLFFFCTDIFYLKYLFCCPFFRLMDSAARGGRTTRPILAIPLLVLPQKLH
jgi:hypothetical protein